MKTNGACKGCSAKDAEIQRLGLLVGTLLERSNATVTEALKITRDALVPTLQPPASGSEYPPLNEDIELWLDAKFTHGTSRWRQQRREAEKLVAAGKDVDYVIETLARGQEIEV